MASIIKVDDVQDAAGNNIINEAGDVITIGGSGDTINIASGATNNLGITEADQWRLDTTFTGDANPIASNLERVDTTGFGRIGTGMTESSGIFTFPSTGIYLVSFNWFGAFTAAQLYCSSTIELTTNDSSYAAVSSGNAQSYASSAYSTSMSQYMVDVTDVANVKVRFFVDAVGSSTSTVGSSTNTHTGFTFIRLGDT